MVVDLYIQYWFMITTMWTIMNYQRLKMYVILVYDCNHKLCGKMLKLCRRYLNWIQNSVFEGDITPSQLEELKYAAKHIMRNDTDSLIIFKSYKNLIYINKV